MAKKDQPQQEPESPETGPIVDKSPGEQVEAQDLINTIDGAFDHLRDMIIQFTHAGGEQSRALVKLYEAKAEIDGVLK